MTILFDGIAYGMLLFILAVGLSVTMGLMNFINLAHGAFAMAGGYTTVLLMQHAGWPFLLCVPLAFVFTALLVATIAVLVASPAYIAAHGMPTSPEALADHAEQGGMVLLTTHHRLNMRCPVLPIELIPA